MRELSSRFFVWQHNHSLPRLCILCYNRNQMKQEAFSHNEAEPLCLYKVSLVVDIPVLAVCDLPLHIPDAL